jgi:catechol 2,3-dioxygenase-like lactoylglutathione lyase family enzyme
MEPADRAIPILPSKSVEAATAFYQLLGFEGGPHPFNRDYAILRRGAIELHFFTQRDLVPTASAAGCYLRVADVAAYYREFSVAQLPPTGIPRMEALEDKPWGLREFAVVDPDGNLLRIGQLLAT